MSGSYILLLILFVAINLISKSQKQKQKEAQKRQAAQQAAASMAAAPAAPKPRKAPVPPADDRFPELSPRENRPLGKAADAGAQGRGRSGSMRAVSLEGVGSGGSLKGAPETKLHHTVKPFTESKHAHVESSITGISALCPPDVPEGVEAAAAQDSEAYSIRTADSAGARRFAFDQSSIRQGFLYGELLGRPKALRR